jgi:adenylate kinase family enzyme
MNPSIIIIGGVPGTGKTTLAELLSKEIEATCFSKDKLEAAILRRGIANKDSLNGVGYELLSEIAKTELDHNRSVILDSVASSQRVLEFWPHIITQKIYYIECICSDEELHKERVEGRSRNITGWYEITWNDILKIKKSYQPFSENRLIIDSANDLSKNVAKAINYVRANSM